MSEDRKAVIRELDKLVRLVLWKREGRCYVCGGLPSDVAHIFGRARLSTRFNVEPAGNCHLLCRKCHDDHHNGGDAYVKTFVRLNGAKALDELRRVANMESPSLGFLGRIHKELKEELA